MSIAILSDFPNAATFQSVAKRLLERHFTEVKSEWRTAKGATDSFSPDVQRYAPRVDLAIGPFNTAPGRASMRLSDIPPIVGQWFEGLTPNDNPRCLLAIEVVYSGSAKHMLGDLLNASALGLYGLVVAHEKVLAKVKRNREYASELANVGKIPVFFRNVRVISFSDFTRAVR